MTVAAEPHQTHDHAHGHPTGWRRYVFSTNHKDIGTMNLVVSICAGLIGGLCPS
jgi:cytochrome c oxidase subunit 1